MSKSKTYSSALTTCKHTDRTPLANDSCGHTQGRTFPQQQSISFSCSRLFHQVAYCHPHMVNLRQYTLIKEEILRALSYHKFSKPLGSQKVAQQLTTLKETAWLREWINLFYSYWGLMLTNRMIGNSTYLWFCMHIAHRYTPPQAYSLFTLMYGRQQSCNHSWHAILCLPHSKKLAELRDLVEANLVEAANHQKQSYDRHCNTREFSVDNAVWLSMPTARKLESKMGRRLEDQVDQESSEHWDYGWSTSQQTCSHQLRHSLTPQPQE